MGSGASTAHLHSLSNDDILESIVELGPTYNEKYRTDILESKINGSIISKLTNKELEEKLIYIGVKDSHDRKVITVHLRNKANNANFSLPSFKLVNTKCIYISYDYHIINDHDEELSNSYQLMNKINTYLVDNDISTHFSGHVAEHHGDIKSDMFTKVDSSLGFVCFITQRYMNRLMTDDHSDIVYSEFHRGKWIHLYSGISIAYIHYDCIYIAYMHHE